jgi:hypothetical protein
VATPMAPGRAVEWRNQRFRVLFFLPFLLTVVRFSLVCAPFDREQQRSAHGGRREKAAPPQASSPELALPLSVERISVERPRVGALGPRHGVGALCHARVARLDPARWRGNFRRGVSVTRRW